MKGSEVGIFGLKEALDFLKVREKIIERKLGACKKCRDFRENLQVTRFEILKATIILSRKGGDL